MNRCVSPERFRPAETSRDGKACYDPSAGKPFAAYALRADLGRRGGEVNTELDGTRNT
jgi:hypothetical protein